MPKPVAGPGPMTSWSHARSISTQVGGPQSLVIKRYAKASRGPRPHDELVTRPIHFHAGRRSPKSRQMAGPAATARPAKPVRRALPAVIPAPRAPDGGLAANGGAGGNGAAGQAGTPGPTSGDSGTSGTGRWAGTAVACMRAPEPRPQHPTSSHVLIVDRRPHAGCVRDRCGMHARAGTSASTSDVKPCTDRRPQTTRRLRAADVPARLDRRGPPLPEHQAPVAAHPTRRGDCAVAGRRARPPRPPGAAVAGTPSPRCRPSHPPRRLRRSQRRFGLRRAACCPIPSSRAG